MEPAAFLQRLHIIRQRVSHDGVEDFAHPLVHRLLQGFQSNLRSDCVVHPRSGDDSFEAHAAVIVVGALQEEFDRVGDVAAGVTKDMGRRRPSLKGLGIETLHKQVAINLVLRPGCPEGFA